jgi:autotransporter-associated beta strand protein
LLGAALSASAASLWNGGGADNNMNNGLNWGGTAPTVGTATRLDFAGSIRTSPVNNFTANSAFGSLYLDSGASAFTLTGNAINLNSTVENDSANLFAIGLSGITATAALVMNPSGSDIMWSTPLTLAANALDLWGTHTTTFTNGANITGTGLLSVHSGTVEINPGSGNTLTCSTRVTVGNGSAATMNFRAGTATFTANNGFFALADNGASAVGVLNIYGGAFNFNLTSQRILLGNSGTGTINVLGGAVSVLSSTALQVGGDSQWGGNNANGTLTISSGTMTVNSGSAFTIAQNLGGGGGTSLTGVQGRLNLYGGTLATGRNVVGYVPASGSCTSSVVFSGGTLKALTGASTLLTTLTSATVSTGGAIIDDGGIAISIAQPLLHDSTLSGADGGLTTKGSSTLTLSGANTFSGGTFLQGGTLTISADNNLGASSGGLTFSGGGLKATASVTTSRPVTFTGAGTIVVNPTFTLTLNSGLNNAAAAGAAVMNLNGGGTLSIKGNATVNNDNAWIVNNATLEVDPGASGTFNVASKMTLANASSSTAIMNLKSGTANITAPDFFVLADGSQTATGIVNVVSGTMNLNMASGNRVMVGLQGSGTLNVTGGMLNMASQLGNIQIGGDTQYSGNNASGTLTLSGSGLVNISGSNPLLLGQNSTGKTGATGRLNLFGGTLTTSRAVTGSSGSSYVVWSGGTLKASATSGAFLTGLTSATVSTNGAILDDGGYALTIAQPLLHDAGLSGTDGGFTKKGSSTLTLAGANTYNGATIISGGKLAGVVGGSCASSAVTVNNTAGCVLGVSITDRTKQWTCAGLTSGGSSTGLDFNFGAIAPSTTLAPLQVNGNVDFSAGTPALTIEATAIPPGSGVYPLLTWTGTMSGTAPTTATLPPHVLATLSVVGNTLQLNVTATAVQPMTWSAGTGTWDIGTTANWQDSTAQTGFTFLNGDTVVLNDTPGGSGPFTITLNSAVTPTTVTVNNTKDYTISGSGSIGGGVLTKQGAGALTLGTANTYSSTVVQAGTLAVSADNNLGAAAGGVTLSGGTLRTTASLTNSRSLTFSGNSIIQVDPSTALVLNTATPTLNNANLDVNPSSGGDLYLAKLTLANVSNSKATNNVKSGTVNLTTQPLVLGDGSPSATGVLNILGGTVNLSLSGGQHTFLGNMGTGIINVAGGALVVAGGTGNVQVGGDHAWSQNNASGTLTISSGSMTVNASLIELGQNDNRGLGFTGAKGYLNLFGGTLTTAGNIAGGNASSYVTFSGGTLKAGAATTNLLSALTSATVSTNGAILDDGGYAITIPQSLQHDTNAAGFDGGLTKLGAGDLTLTGANTYNGPTLVTAGRLFINGSLGTNTVTVTNGATLLGAGTINGPVSVLAGGTLQPGSTGTDTGTLSLNQPLTLAGNTVLLLNKTNAQAASLVQSTANISYGGTLTVSNLGPSLQANDTFTLFTAGSYGNSFAASSLPPLSGNLAWDTTSLTLNGTISVATVASVTISPATTNAECASTITLTAIAAGTPPLTYQWFDNQTNTIAGATNAALTLTNVHSAQAGNYTVQVANSVGNASAIASVTVSDTTPPVITLNGPNPMTVECHGSFADPGATALDACVGPVAAVPSGTVDPNTTGAYTLTYTANDGNGNTATVFRTVNVTDTTAPAITWSFTNLTLSADANCQALMPDVTGTNYILGADACSVSLAITQTPTNNTILTLGTNEVVIAVADSTGNTAYSTNTVVVADTTAPAITLLGANPLTNECHSAFADPGATALDNCSGVVSLSTNSTVNANAVGIYTIDYVASDAAGNTATNTRIVYVADTTAPVVTLNGANPLMVECHGGLSDPGASADDACAGNLSVSVSGTVNANAPGTYTLTYSATDPSGNTGSATRTVIVQDTAPPQITFVFTNLVLNAASSNCQVSLPDLTGTNYIIAADSCSSVTVTQTPLIGTVLSYGTTNEVVLTALDASGNAAYSTNTVVVAEGAAPVITTQPQSLTNLVGTDAVFTEQATSCGPVSYQWYLNTNALAEQTNATLTVTNVQLADAGSYLVTLANAAGSSTSAVAVLTVNRPPVASNTNAGVTENQALVLDNAKLLALCSDLDGDPLSIISAGPLSTNGGSVTLTSSNVTYLPLTNFVGADRFDFTVSDGRGGSATGSVLVAVTSASAPSLNIVSGPDILPNGHFYVGFAGIPGLFYTIQYSANADGPWTTLTNLMAGTNGLFDFEDLTEPAPPTRFYRTTYP